jgi:ADP-heptose:LPS heptosyltransferase
MKILVIDRNFMGDVLMGTPVYRAIRQMHPLAEVHVLTWPGSVPVLERNPFVDRVHTSVWGLRRFDIVMQLNTSLKTNLFMLALWPFAIRIGYNYRGLGRMNTHRPEIAQRTARKGNRTEECLRLWESFTGETAECRAPMFFTSPASHVRVFNRLVAWGIEDRYLVVLHSCTRNTRKARMLSVEKYAAIADALIDRGAFVLLTGSESDRPFCGRIAHATRQRHVLNVAGEFSVEELGALSRQVAMVVTVNSFPMHLAVAVGVPCVAIIGGTPASVVAPVDQTRFRYVEDPGLDRQEPDGNYPIRLAEVGVAEVMERVRLLS